MKKLLISAVPVLMLGLITSAAHAQYNPNYNNQQQGYPQQQGNYPQQQRDGDHRDWDHMDRNDWDAPPADFTNDVNRRAFHDGIDAARVDFQNNRRMDYDEAARYRRPPVARNMRDMYRQSFVRGYQTAQHRMEWMRAHQENDWHHDHDNWRNNYPYNQPQR